MITRIGDGTQFQTAAAVTTALAGGVVNPDRAREEFGKREPIHEAPARETETDEKHQGTDLGLKSAEGILADIADPNVGVTFVKVEGIDEPVIRVVNRETGEVVRQIPPDEVLELKKRFADLVGMFKDLKA